ncbi:hypothetical protein [Coxiella-like endosymbiont of Rhipicephalus sanguineus]|uniref:hypothetical protein n=1 Tax=Coxiella-like endosymbiont of Rhipicephalus sanguineus TaxID=1955402 RepID=UPI0020408DD0|nr:hypothetical protein [Coxiella-like endosymbiont of Rhipicephalus sanguineus]
MIPQSRALIILVNTVVMIAHPKRVQEQAKPRMGDVELATQRLTPNFIRIVIKFTKLVI